MPRLHHPAVSLTDAALGFEAAFFALRLGRRPKGTARARALGRSLTGLFAATSVASSCGAVLHGLVPDRNSTANRVLWRVSLIAIGGAALSGWSIGARLRLPPSAASRVERVAAAEFAAYALLAASTTLPYRIAIANYLPAAVFLALALAAQAARSDRRRGARIGLIALALTFVAAAVQAKSIALHPRYFDHNALYHAIQGVAIAMLFGSARRLIDPPAYETS